MEINTVGGGGMGYGDWIFLGALLIVFILGAIMGFGKVVSMFVLNKIVRIIVAIFVCYTYGAMILGMPAISQLLTDLAANWSHIGFLTAIHLDLIIYYIALFLITMLVLVIAAKILKGISESKALPVKILNKVCGAVLFSALALALMLLGFHIITWIGGETKANFGNLLAEKGNKILLPLFENNPILKLIDYVKAAI